MTIKQERLTIAPATVWQKKTGNEHLKPDFMDWIVEKKRKFVILMERAGRPVDPAKMSQEEIDIFCAWVCETEGIFE